MESAGVGASAGGATAAARHRSKKSDLAGSRESSSRFMKDVVESIWMIHDIVNNKCMYCESRGGACGN
jgi:hypothetical protein